MDHELDSARAFFENRGSFMKVEAIDRPDGGWDVWVRLDGTYSPELDKEEMTAHFEERIKRVFDHEEIPTELRPPWLGGT